MLSLLKEEERTYELKIQTGVSFINKSVYVELPWRNFNLKSSVRELSRNMGRTYEAESQKIIRSRSLCKF